MPILKILAVAIGMTVGSLLTAALLAYLAWWVASHIRNRRYAWMLLLAMIGAIWFVALGHSEFFKMAAMFGLIASIGLYVSARATKKTERPSRGANHRLGRARERIVIVRQIWFYPALIAVLGEERRPNFAELRNLVRRIRREVTAANAQRGAHHRQIVRDLVMAALKPPARAQALHQ